MDCAAHPATRQKLAHQIHRWSLTLARVSHSPAPVRPLRSDTLRLHPHVGAVCIYMLLTTSRSFLWCIAALPLGVYVIVQDLNVPLIVQPQVFGFLSLLSWGQCMYYDAGRSRAWCTVVLGSMLAVWGALEAALVFALRVRVLSLCVLC